MTSKEFPIIQDIKQRSRLFTIGDHDLQIDLIEGKTAGLPDYFQTNVYALTLLVRGRITANINHHLYDVIAPSFAAVLINQVISVIDSSEDTQQYIISFSPRFAEDLNLQLPLDAHIKAYMHPVFPLQQQQMKIATQYLSLLIEMAQTPNMGHIREVALNLVRSMAYYIYGYYNRSCQTLNLLSRSEELTGHFLALVEHYSHIHHNIDWYASEMRLSPKYIANVVKQVTGRTAGDCITQNLIKQAKSMLLTTTLSIQEITDRLGFQNQSHFGTFFRRNVGVSPKKFRENRTRPTQPVSSPPHYSLLTK